MKCKRILIIAFYTFLNLIAIQDFSFAIGIDKFFLESNKCLKLDNFSQGCEELQLVYPTGIIRGKNDINFINTHDQLVFSFLHSLPSRNSLKSKIKEFKKDKFTNFEDLFQTIDIENESEKLISIADIHKFEEGLKYLNQKYQSSVDNFIKQELVTFIGELKRKNKFDSNTFGYSFLFQLVKFAKILLDETNKEYSDQFLHELILQSIFEANKIRFKIMTNKEASYQYQNLYSKTFISNYYTNESPLYQVYNISNESDNFNVGQYEERVLEYKTEQDFFPNIYIVNVENLKISFSNIYFHPFALLWGSTHHIFFQGKSLINLQLANRGFYDDTPYEKSETKGSFFKTEVFKVSSTTEHHSGTYLIPWQNREDTINNMFLEFNLISYLPSKRSNPGKTDSAGSLTLGPEVNFLGNALINLSGLPGMKGPTGFDSPLCSGGVYKPQEVLEGKFDITNLKGSEQEIYMELFQKFSIKKDISRGQSGDGGNGGNGGKLTLNSESQKQNLVLNLSHGKEGLAGNMAACGPSEDLLHSNDFIGTLGAKGLSGKILITNSYLSLTGEKI